MKRLFFTIFLLFLLFLIFSKNPISAEDRCTWSFTDENGNDFFDPYWSINKINYTLTIEDANKNPKANYNIKLCNLLELGGLGCRQETKSVDPDGKIRGSFDLLPQVGGNSRARQTADHLNVEIVGGVEGTICTQLLNWKDPPPSQSAECNLTLDPPKNITQDKDITLTGKITNVKGLSDYSIFKSFGGDTGQNPIIELRGQVKRDFRGVNITNGGKEFSVDLLSNYPDGNYTATVKLYITGFLTGYIPVSCSISFTIPDGVIPTATPIPTPTIPALCNDKSARDDKLCSGDYADCPWCPKAKRKKLGLDIPQLKPLCDQLGGEFRGKCWDCQKTGGIWSAIGCLPTDFTALLKDYVFKTGVGAAGGIAFIYFLYGAFMILTSSGNAEKMEEAKQIITSALAGLILIIFSVFLLRVIGIDILQIPGFT